MSVVIFCVKIKKMENKKKVVNVDQIYVSVVLVERVWRQTALSNGLKNKWILGQQKTIITSLSFSLSRVHLLFYSHLWV